MWFYFQCGAFSWSCWILYTPSDSFFPVCSALKRRPIVPNLEIRWFLIREYVAPVQICQGQDNEEKETCSCVVFTLSVYRPRSLGELGACWSQRQLDRKCKPLCWRVYFCSDKNCSYKGPLYSTPCGPQRGGAERAHLANASPVSSLLSSGEPMSPGPPATTFTPSHWGHWGRFTCGTPCTVSLPLPTPTCKSPRQVQ